MRWLAVLFVISALAACTDSATDSVTASGGSASTSVGASATIEHSDSGTIDGLNWSYEIAPSDPDTICAALDFDLPPASVSIPSGSLVISGVGKPPIVCDPAPALDSDTRDAAELYGPVTSPNGTQVFNGVAAPGVTAVALTLADDSEVAADLRPSGLFLVAAPSGATPVGLTLAVGARSVLCRLEALPASGSLVVASCR